MNAVENKSVLDAVRHKRLIEDFQHICAVAHVPGKYVRESMIGYCDSAEVDWVANFRLYRHTHPGLLITGKANAEERCMAIVGALLRNFIDARLVTLSQLLEAHEEGRVPNPTVMVIPNLFMQTVGGKTLPAWQLAVVYDILVSRWADNNPTVVAVENFSAMQQAYGLSFAQHLQNYKA